MMRKKVYQNMRHPHPFIIEVQDKNGLPLEGVPVTFVVTSGDGSLSATSTELRPTAERKVSSRWECVRERTRSRLLQKELTQRYL